MFHCNLEERIRTRNYELALVQDRALVGQVQPPKGSVPTVELLTESLYATTGKDLPLGHGSSEFIDQVIPESMRKRCWKATKGRPYRVFKDTLQQRESKTIVPTGKISYFAHYYSPYTSSKDKWMVRLAENHFQRGYDNPETRFASPIDHTVSDSDLRAGFARLAPDTDNLLGDIQLANFLIELKDLKQLTKLTRIPKDLYEASAGNFLGVNFGVLPVIGDIKKIINLHEKLSKKLAMWNEVALKGAILDFHTTLFKFDETNLVEEPLVYLAFDGTVQYRQVVSNSAKLHLYIQPEPLNASYLDIAWQTLGLDKPLAVVWEALPFSWFIDYFLNIQELIDNFEKSASPFKYTIVDAGYSYTLKNQCYSQLGSWDVIPSYKDQPQAIYDCTLPTVWYETTKFQRVSISPAVAQDFISLGEDWQLLGDGTSPHQLALSLAVGAGFVR